MSFQSVSSSSNRSPESETTTDKEKEADQFQFRINYKRHPQLLLRFWITSISHFDKILESFIIEDGWLYDDFMKIVLQKKLHNVFRCVLSSNAANADEQREHYYLALQTILDAAKIQLLAPWKKFSTFGLTTCIKRQVGGLFLLYFLVTYKPVPPDAWVERQPKIILDSDDIQAFRLFIRDVAKLINEGFGPTLKSQVFFIYKKLKEGDHLEFSAISYYSAADGPLSYLYDVKKNSEVQYFATIKDLRDQLLYLTYQGIGNHIFKQLMSSNQLLSDQGIGMRKKQNHSGATSKFPPEKKLFWTIQTVRELKDERDLAVISFRLIEVLKFITPPSPFTPARLNPESRNYEVQFASDLNSVIKKEEALHEYYAQIKRGTAKKDRNQQEVNKMTNRGWKSYLYGETEDKYQAPSESEILKKMDEGISLQDLLDHCQDSIPKKKPTVSYPIDESNLKTSLLDMPDLNEFKDSSSKAAPRPDIRKSTRMRIKPKLWEGQ